MRQIVAVLWFYGILVLGFKPVALAHEVVDPSKYVTNSLTVSGEVKETLELTVGELKRLPSRTLKDITIVSKRGAKIIKSLKGVLLRDLLEKAEIKSKAHGDMKRMYIVASASDGYKAVFSWNEIFNSPIGDGIIVAYEKNGMEIEDADGKILLLSSKDFMTGSRHVRWLKAVEVRKILD